MRPETKIIGVEAVDADAMTRSLQAGKRVRLDRVGLFADGAAVKYVGEETFRLCQQYVDEMVPVSYTHLDVYKRQVLDRQLDIDAFDTIAVIAHARQRNHHIFIELEGVGVA